MSEDLTVHVSRAHFPVTSLGFGRRVGIWLQGCSIHCPGCVSRDTWEVTAEHATTINSVINTCSPWLREAEGVTITGGEPFDQPEALDSLIREIRRRCNGDILVFSGYSYELLVERHASILQAVDALISDPFVAEVGQSLPLRGSDNQRIWLLSELGRNRYRNISSEITAARRLDLMMGQDTAWLAGIPAVGDMSRLRARLKEMGFDCSTTDQPAEIQ